MKLRDVAGMLLLSMPASAFSETLAQLVDQAWRQNPEVSVAQAQLRQAEARWMEARAGQGPSLDLTFRVGADSARFSPPGDYLNLGTRGGSVRLTQPLFAGGGIQADIERFRASRDGAYQRLREVKRDIASRLGEAAYRVTAAQELQQVAQQSAERHRATVEAMEIIVSQDPGRRFELAQAQSRWTTAQANLAFRKAQTETARAMLKRLLGREVEAVRLPADLTPPAESEASAQVREVSPALAAASQDIEATKAALKVVRSAYLPRLALELDATSNHNVGGFERDFRSQSISLVGSWNLFRSGADWAREKGVRAQIEGAEGLLENARLELDYKLGSGYADWRAQQFALAQFKQQVQHAETSYQAALDQFRIGRASLLDVLNLQSEAFQARSSVSSSYWSAQLSAYELVLLTTPDLENVFETWGLQPTTAQSEEKSP